MAVTVTDNNFRELVLKSDKPVLLDFWAEWCAPCRMIAPFVEQLATEYEGKALVGKVNIEQSPDITEAYGIRNIPTVVYFKEGLMVDKHVGAASKNVLAGKLNALL